MVGTYGLSDNLDVSIAIPLVDVRMTMDSSATIISFEAPPPSPLFYRPRPQRTSRAKHMLVRLFANFVNSNSAFGIGDLRLRAKYAAWHGAQEKAAVAVGSGYRLPTGDAYKFLGSGTWGLRPFVIYSYSGRVSPHASAGLEVNGNSVLAGTVTSQPVATGQLPNVFSYSAGADPSVARWLGLSADYIGTSLLNESRLETSTFQDSAGNNHPTITTSVSTVNQANISAGAKVHPF